MEPNDALVAIEVALRLAVRDVLGANAWIEAPGAPEQTKLIQRRDEEQKRRDGARASNDLLNYTETYHLTGIIRKNWEKFKPVFDDKGRTETFFGIIEDVRNSIAHSRDLVPFERNLIAGVAGMIRNQVSLFRSSVNQSSKYYPLIESVKDSFGIEGREQGNEGYYSHSLVRLEVGDVITFTGSAFSAKGKEITWSHQHLTLNSFSRDEGSTKVVATGDTVTFTYTVKESDVGEHLGLNIRIASESRFHRHRHHYPEWSYDDQRLFHYAVNPPEDED